MKEHCSYCNSLHKAIKDQNFCSQQGDSISSVSTNAYYFKTNALFSGDHVSRLSIRTISDGYQHHKVNNKDYVLDKNQYLLINEGEEFNSEIMTNHPVEGLLVAFRTDDIGGLIDLVIRSENSLLDDPFVIRNKDIKLETQKMNMSDRLDSLFHLLKKDITSDDQLSLYYEEFFHQMLKQVLNDHLQIEKKIADLKYKKDNTKQEIYYRLRQAREYIDGHIHQDVSLRKLSRVATLSPFHLLRNFQEFYNVSPHKYLVSKRLQKAKFLLKDTNLNLEEVANAVGFKNKSSFGRLFKSEEKQSPMTFRFSHQSQNNSVNSYLT